MGLIRTHTCQIDTLGEPCQCETQTRCAICRRWCCLGHRETLSLGLRRRVILCSTCIYANVEVKEEE